MLVKRYTAPDIYVTVSLHHWSRAMRFLLKKPTLKHLA